MSGYNRKYYKQNRAKILARASRYNKKYYVRNSRKLRAYTAAYRKAHLAERNEYNRLYRRKLKSEVLREYGGRCACCKEHRLPFLVVDHINGGGTRHMRKVGLGFAFYRWLKKRGFPMKDKLRVLCANCNTARNCVRVCPHKRGTV